MKRRLTPSVRHRQQDHQDWKESLRKACFDRARKNRKDVIWKRRNLEQQQQQEAPTTYNNGNVNQNDNEHEIRSVVEQELRQQRVAVVSPGVVYRQDRPTLTTLTLKNVSPDTSLEANDPSNQMMMGLERQNSYDSDSTEYVISEEELYELLQEVEEDLRRSEEELLEEVLEQEQCQQQEIDDQIAEFEEWENSLATAASNVEECVVCPICCESMLRQSPNHDDDSHRSIYCPNEACQFYLPQPSSYAHPNNSLTLAELKERLRLAFEGHSSRCSGTLTFEMQPLSACVDPPQQAGCLVGSCQQCHVRLSIT